MSTTQGGEDRIRRSMIEADVVDCMIALPGQLFYSTPIPACLWFLARNKNPGGNWRDRRRETLFIDARNLGHLVDRRELPDDDIAKIARVYHAWRGEPTAGKYQDIPGFCKAAPLSEIQGHNYVLTPGRYVGSVGLDEDDTPFIERFGVLQARLQEEFAKGRDLQTIISRQLLRIGDE